MGTIISPDGRFEWDEAKNILNDEQIAELQNFKTKNFTDCPVQTQEQLQEFKPKYPDARLYKPVKQVVQIRI
jgi:hypothetical protein